jgi:hypothetical protein
VRINQECIFSTFLVAGGRAVLTFL